MPMTSTGMGAGSALALTLRPRWRPFGKLRQIVGDLEPRGFGADPTVGQRASAGVAVERAETDAQMVLVAGRPAVDRRAAAGAEGAELPRRGLELPDLVAARQKGDVAAPDVGVGGEGRAAGPPALRAVAVHDRAETAGDSIADATAQAVTGDPERGVLLMHGHRPSPGH